MTLQIVLALYPLVLAGIAVYWALTARPRGPLPWAIEIAASGGIAAFAFMTGPWGYTSYYLRYLAVGFWLIAVLYACGRATRAGVEQARSLKRLATSSAVGALFMVLNILGAASQVPASELLHLSFPLAAGTYYVIQGGNSFVTNPFHSLSGEPLALDIVRLNAFGNRASGIAPRALADYEIFGDIVRSPCDGTVVGVQDTVADNPPGVSSIQHPANHVTLRCGDAEIYIAHLMQNSAAVATGKAVNRGEPLGRVGNSGYTLEPHLHIGASKGGNAVGLLFNRRWLSVNSLVVTR